MSCGGVLGVTPFGVRPRSLVPLDVAFSRNDIRRRGEAFESQSHADLSYESEDWTTASPGARRMVTSASSPIAGSPWSTPTSLYSNPCSPALTGRPRLHQEVFPAAEDAPWESSVDQHSFVTPEDVEWEVDVSDSFDEESFIRIAERSLGW